MWDWNDGVLSRMRPRLLAWGREWGAVSDEGETVDCGDLVPMRRTLV